MPMNRIQFQPGMSAGISQTVRHWGTMWGRVRTNTMASRICLSLLCLHRP